MGEEARSEGNRDKDDKCAAWWCVKVKRMAEIENFTRSVS